MSFERENNSITIEDVLNYINVPGFVGRSLLGNTGIPRPVRRSSNINTTVDIVNEERYIYVYVEIPGVNKEDISLDFYNNQITICADKNRNYNSPEVSEIKYGRIERTITLPICVTRKETVNVVYKNGILRIKINKFIEEENKFSVRLDDGETS